MPTARYKLTEYFAGFFGNINPPSDFNKLASRAYDDILTLIQDPAGPASHLKVQCFLQGSYRQDRAIHSISDVDIVALSGVRYVPGRANRNTRQDIFRAISESIAAKPSFGTKIAYSDGSMCIKVFLEGLRVEVLPGLIDADSTMSDEPFWIFDPRPAPGVWRPTFARHHQSLVSSKNSATGGLYVPMVKCLKHLREFDDRIEKADAPSYLVECLLYALTSSVYQGSAAECLEAILTTISKFTPEKALSSAIRSPCRDKVVFDEWDSRGYERFFIAAKAWAELAHAANTATTDTAAIEIWKSLLGDSYFSRR